MKIAFIVIAFPRLSETFILNQITGLLDMGHDVEIFTSSIPKEKKVHFDVEKYHLMERVHYSWRLFNNKEFDIIHCHYGPSGIIGMHLKKVGIPAKYITSFHGFDVLGYVKKQGEKVYQELFARGDLFTYNSEATKEKLINLGCPTKLMIKLPMGTDINKLTFEEKKVALNEQINILSVGRLFEIKGREYAIRAVAKIVKKFPNINYKIAGNGPLRGKLKRLIKNLQIERRIHLLGWVDDKELDYLYRTSHIFLHPSVTPSDGDMEGQGVVLLEAQAYGLPVIATKYSAFPESVVDGKSGFLVPEKDVDALAERIKYLIEHSEIWPEMGRCGRKFVEEKYDIKRLNQRLVKIYKALLSDNTDMLGKLRRYQ